MKFIVHVHVQYVRSVQCKTLLAYIQVAWYSMFNLHGTVYSICMVQYVASACSAGPRLHPLNPLQWSVYLEVDI